MTRGRRLRTAALTLAALAAFAANSLLCRRALDAGLADPAGFTFLRMASGALVLALIAGPRLRRVSGRPAPLMALFLFLYMAGFSFAYRSLDAGTGALLLFGAVQGTMFLAALAGGERFAPTGWLGLGLACAGLIGLLAPGSTAPDPAGAALMLLAGVAWGGYSLLGRGAGDPLVVTALNFLLGTAPAVALAWWFRADFLVTVEGVALAVASGALASGIGYAIWYAALKGLSAGHAATVQLSVPVLAALGGVWFLSEALTLRLVLAGAATLGGIALVLSQRARGQGGT